MVDDLPAAVGAEAVEVAVAVLERVEAVVLPLMVVAGAAS